MTPTTAYKLKKAADDLGFHLDVDLEYPIKFGSFTTPTHGVKVAFKNLKEIVERAVANDDGSVELQGGSVQGEMLKDDGTLKRTKERGIPQGNGLLFIY